MKNFLKRMLKGIVNNLIRVVLCIIVFVISMIGYVFGMSYYIKALDWAWNFKVVK